MSTATTTLQIDLTGKRALMGTDQRVLNGYLGC